MLSLISYRAFINVLISDTSEIYKIILLYKHTKKQTPMDVWAKKASNTRDCCVARDFLSYPSTLILCTCVNSKRRFFEWICCSNCFALRFFFQFACRMTCQNLSSYESINFFLSCLPYLWHGADCVHESIQYFFSKLSPLPVTLRQLCKWKYSIFFFWVVSLTFDNGADCVHESIQFFFLSCLPYLWHGADWVHARSLMMLTWNEFPVQSLAIVYWHWPWKANTELSKVR